MNVDVDYKNILIAINFTDTSRLTFYVALKYARSFDANLWVLHVTKPIDTFDGEGSVEKQANEMARLEEGVKRRINELFESGGLREVDRRKVLIDFRAGDVATEILHASVERNIDLIVMGKNPEKRRGLKKLVSHSPAEKVVDKAQCHVLVVKPSDYRYTAESIPEKFSNV